MRKEIKTNARPQKGQVMKHTTLAFLCALTLLAGKAHAEVPAILVTEYTPMVTNSSHLAMHGMHLVWQAKGGLYNTTSTGMDWEIFAYDLQAGTISQITDDADDDLMPRTDGNSIVWQKHDPREGNQVFLYNLSGNNPQGGTKISTAEDGDNFAPAITDGIVVWNRQKVGQAYHPQEILYYNTKTQYGPVVISNPAYNSSTPRIVAGQIIFKQDNPNGTDTILTYDVNEQNPVAKPAPTDFPWYATSKQVDGQQTVLSRYSGTNREIFLHTRKNGYTPITANGLANKSPVISQNHIAWTAQNDIYLAEIARLMQVQTTSGSDSWATGFRAFWSALSGGVDHYIMDVATDPDFKNFVEGYRGLQVGNATQYFVDGLNPETTYYYRVQAVINGSTTDYSQKVAVKLPKAGAIAPGVKALPHIYNLLLK